MTNSIQKNPQGPFWPLGAVTVVAPGTPVNMMFNIDPNNYNAPETATVPQSAEYTVRAQQIIIQGMKSNSGAGLVNNTGNIYVVMKGVGSGTGNRADTGSIVLTVPSGTTGVLASAPLVRNVFSPYELYIDADNAGDAAQVTLLIQ
jgi:hypothetical protein